MNRRTTIRAHHATRERPACLVLRRQSNVSGQAVVEMALVVMLLLVLIFGAVDVLQNLMVQYTISQSVRTAAHEAALMGSTGGMTHGRPYVLKDAPGPVASAARTVRISRNR